MLSFSAGRRRPGRALPPLSLPLRRRPTLLLRSVLLVLLVLLGGCDSTPRERQAAAREGLRQLDTVARGAGRSLRRVGSAAVRLDSANRARKSRPLQSGKQTAADQYLLGPFSGQLGSLSVATIPDAYAHLLRQTRASRRQWSARDWDYAADTYRRLNAELARVRLDLPASSEVRIRAWQAEFKALQANRSVKELRALTAPKPAGRPLGPPGPGRKPPTNAPWAAAAD